MPHMPIQNIKMTLFAKRALKPDAFSKYIEFLFDTFPEAEAKKLANSFIGNLGLKYHRTNQGFTSTSYETAMSCWTSGLAEGKNITVDSHDGIFLVRDFFQTAPHQQIRCIRSYFKPFESDLGSLWKEQQIMGQQH